MTKPQFERAERAILFAPIYRLHVIAYFQLDDTRPWDRLPPLLQEQWCALAQVALMVNKRVIELTYGTPTAGGGTHPVSGAVARGLQPGAAGGDSAHSFSAPASASEPRRDAGAAAGEPAQPFSPLKRYVSPLTQVK